MKVKEMTLLEKDHYVFHSCQRGDASKPPIVVIGSALYYPRLFQDECFAGFNLIFIDHRGFVQPKSDAASYSLADVVDDIEAFRLQLGLEKMVLLGHSGHGFMAMAYAQAYGEHVAGLILSNLAPTNSPERQAGSLAYFDQTASATRKALFAAEISHLAADIEADPDHRFSHINRRMRTHAFYAEDYAGPDDWAGVVNHMPALDYLWGVAFAEFDTAGFLRQWSGPLLLLLCDHDYLVGPPSLWDALIQEQEIDWLKFHQSGHNPMLEEPQAYAAALTGFMSTIYLTTR
ncbi:alpha/beta fold hydrolase [Neisseriaceae bacterium CLB008]